MDVALGNATDNIINVDGTGGVTIASVLIGAGRKLTKAGTGALTLNGTNHFSGDTTISAGKLTIGGSINSSPNLIIAGGGTLELPSAYALASGQGLKGSGSGSFGSLALGGNLTLASNSPLQFTAYNGATAPLATVSGAGTVVLSASNPVTVTTTTQLSAGSYTLFSKSAGGGVSGTAPTSLTIGGSGLASGTAASLSITGAQLVMNVVNTTGKYRSRQSGNWNDFNTWQTDTGGGFVNAVSGQTPTSAADTIQIQSPHTVTVTANVDADQLTVDNGGTLSVNSGVTFTVADGTGTDLTVNGAATTAGAFTTVGQTTINGTFELNNGGSVVTNAPTYNNGSTLIYNVTNLNFHPRGLEWSATSGAGYPFNVQINNNSSIDLGAGGANVARQIEGALTINSGGELSMDATPMTAALTVKGNVNISGGTLTLSSASGGDLNLGGNFTNNGTFVNNNRTVTFNGTSAQSIGGTNAIAFHGFTTATGASVSSSVSFNVTGNWTNDGAYTGASETITFNGALAQTIGGANPSNFNSITLNNSTGVSFTSNQNVNGNLGLAGNDLTTGTNILVMPNTATSSGTFDVVGNVRRTGFVNGAPLTFGNPNTRITFTAGTPATDVTVNLVKSRPTGSMGFPNAVNRTYTITPNGGSGYTATLRLHYKDAELFGSPVLEESLLDLWRFDGATWLRKMKTGFDTVTANNKWIESNTVTQFSPWTLSATPLAPTVSTLRALRATRYTEGTLIEWRTGFEADNLGFNLYREVAGRRTLVNSSPVAGSALIAGRAALTAGNSYTWVDRAGAARAVYWLEDVDMDGTRTMHGPFKLTPARAGQRMPPGHRSLLLSQLGVEGDARGSQSQWMPASETADEGAAPEVGRAVHGESSTGTPASIQNKLASREAVKLSVRRAGWYRVTRAELEAAGLDPNAAPTHLQLYAEGVEQAIAVNDDAWRQGAGAVEFYGEGLDVPSTDTRVYWLILGDTPGRRIVKTRGGNRPPGGAQLKSNLPGSNINPGDDAREESGGAEAAALASKEHGASGPLRPIRPKPTPPVSTATSFSYTVERRDRTIYFSSLLNGAAENFFGHVINPSAGPQLISVREHDTAVANPASLEVAVQGVTTTPHEVHVRLNGAEVGVMSFAGRERKIAAFQINQAALLDGDNEVQLVSNASSDVSLTDYIRLTYMRRYRAVANSLRFPAPDGLTVRANGFTSDDIRVMDVTDANNVEELPVTVEPATEAEGGGFAVRFTPRIYLSPRTLLAFAGDSAVPVAAAAPNAPSTLRDAANKADFLVITHRDFRESIAPLVARREREGLSVKVVDVEDIFDEFSHGAHTPQALKDFLAAARSSWRVAPSYVLLVGDGSYDPRGHLGRGAFDFVPTKLIDATYLETASDDWYADADDDDLAELALGRLPVRTPDEAALVAAKIATHTPGSNREAAVTVADRDGSDGYSFETATAGIESELPAAVTVERVNRGARPAADVRAEITTRIGTGPLLVNYMGHGSVGVWTGEGLLRTEDAGALSNGSRLSFFVLMTCLNGYYSDPTLESLGEALLKAEGGGALAVWASTGLTEPDGQAAINRELYRLLFNTSEPLTLGEAVRRAKAATADPDVRRTWVLFGDPATRLR